MRAKEAIHILDHLRPADTKDSFDAYIVGEALEMAINALEQEPTKEEKALLQKWRDNRGISIEDFEDAMNTLKEPSGDLISRQAVIDELNKWDWQELYLPIHFKENIIDVVPSVMQKSETVTEFADRCRECGARYGKLLKQEPKTGHWIGHREHCENLGVIPSGLGAYEWCSNCDCGIDVREWHRNNYNYCPNCGCRMVEPQESEG